MTKDTMYPFDGFTIAVTPVQPRAKWAFLDWLLPTRKPVVKVNLHQGYYLDNKHLRRLVELCHQIYGGTITAFSPDPNGPINEMRIYGMYNTNPRAIHGFADLVGREADECRAAHFA